MSCDCPFHQLLCFSRDQPLPGDFLTTAAAALLPAACGIALIRLLLTAFQEAEERADFATEVHLSHRLMLAALLLGEHACHPLDAIELVQHATLSA